MKKHNIILALGFLTMGLTGCQDGDWDKEINENYKIGNELITEHNVISIKDLKAKYKHAILGDDKDHRNNTVELITEDIQIKGIVITNDRGGNTSQCINITDNSGENIQVSIADNDIMTYLPVGQEILIDLKDLYIGGYSETPIIGYPNEKYAGTLGEDGTYIGSEIYRMSFMSRFLWYKHFKAIGKPAKDYKPEIIELKDEYYNNELAYVCKLIYVDGKFTTCEGDKYTLTNDGNQKIADPNQVKSTDTGNGVNWTFKGTNCKNSIVVRTSTYADFSASLVPDANVRMYGVMTRDTYNKGFQIQLRDADDIAIYCEGCEDFVGSTKWTKTEEGDYKCNKCGTIVKKGGGKTPEPSVDVIKKNCAEAAAIVARMEDGATSTETYEVSGYITKTIGSVSRNQQSFWMADTKDGGEVIQAYWANLPEGVSEFVVGSKVKITGKLIKYVKSGAVTPEIKNADVVIEN